MKIAIVTPTFPPYAGGIGNVAAANARELVKLGHEVTVFTPLYQPVTEEITDLVIKRVKPLFKYGNAAYVPSLKKLLAGFEIIHLHYPFFGGAEVIWLKSSKFKAHGSKLVLHYHMDVVGEGILKLFFKLHNQFILPKIIRMADKVIFTSLDYGQNSNVRNLMAKNPDKFIEVANGVNTEEFLPTEKDKSLLAKHAIEPEEKVVLFVGGLDKAHYFKGVEYLIEAMSRLKQLPYRWKLIIVGAGELQRQYADWAAQLNLEAKTIFTGYVPNQDLPKYYNLADVVVLPSVDKSEAFGLALVEGMSCGKPVVATNLPGVRSVVDDGVNGLLVKIKDEDDLASKINYLLANSEIAGQFGLAARQKAEKQYDWGIIGQKLEQIYQKL
ncbi:MAG: glycosyltransferase family 4 protein [Patescibacteria group bacterium]|jgi:glycosyltransferase involved in cell wall biosynthesis